MKIKSILLFLFLFIGLTAIAQVTTSNMRGTITDDQGAPLLGANVIAVHVPTGTRYGGISNEDGRYNLRNMRVGGPYEVTVTYVGYGDRTQSDIFLTLGKTYIFDATLLSEAQALDEVIVVYDHDIFGNDRTGAETSVGARELTRLPTISRSAADFTRLEPTANAGSSGVSFAGRNDQYNNFSLDGAIFNNPFGLDAATPGGQTNAQPISLDAISQIVVATAPYDVTLAGFTGASVNAVTKSGTNTFYGTAYGFFRNDDLTGGKIDGEDVFKTGLEQSQYGLSIGGPIVKDKLFFFFNYENDELTELGTAGFAPNAGRGSLNESRVSAADFRLVDNLLRDVVIGQDEQGNDIFYDPGRFEDFNFDQESSKGIVKLDWNINDKNRLAVIYNWLNASKQKPAHPSALGFRGPNASTLQFENAGYEINNNIKSVQVELNSQIADDASNKLQVGYTHFDDFRNPLSSPAPTITILDAAGASNYIIAGHEPFSINNRLDQKVFQLTNNLNYYRGNHTYTIGFSFEKFEFDNSFNLGVYGAQGVFFPTTTITDFPDFASSGQLQAAFNTAISADAGFNAAGTGNPGGWALSEVNVGQMAFYMQDEWDVNLKFKLTYGIRFDKPLYFDTEDKVRENIERKGGAMGTYIPSIQYFDGDTGDPTFLDSEVLPTDKWLISPRVGFNYDLSGQNTEQFRGGSGIFTGRFPFVWLGNQTQGLDFFFYQVVDPDFQWPQVWRTNIGYDKQFRNGIQLSADISYTKDINAAHVQNWGLGTPTERLMGGPDDRPVYSNDDKAMIFGGPTNAYVFTNSDKGRIWNMAVKGQKTWNNGLYAMLAYSFLDSKEVNSIEAEITGDAFAANAISGNANEDVLAYSRYGDNHRIIGVVSKAFPKSGTTVSTFFEYASGARYNYIYGGDINNDGSSINDLLYIPTASELGSMTFSGPGQAAAFEAFIQQDDYLSDNRGSYAERYAAQAPWRGRWDIKILQDLKFNNKNKLQFSLDVLNVGNFLNSKWGIVEDPAFNQLVGVSVDASNNPTYTFDPDLVNTYTAATDARSRWRAQVGLRYIFN